MSDLVLSYIVNKRGIFSWPVSIPLECHPICPHKGRLVCLSYYGDPRKKDAAKHIWVRRNKSGNLQVAPGVHAKWEKT